MKPTLEQSLAWASQCNFVFNYPSQPWPFAYCDAEAIRQVVTLAYQAGAESEQRTCNWTYDQDDGFWAGDCGIAFCLENETPELNEMYYCPKCGGKLEVKE